MRWHKAYYPKFFEKKTHDEKDYLTIWEGVYIHSLGTVTFYIVRCGDNFLYYFEVHKCRLVYVKTERYELPYLPTELSLKRTCNKLLKNA